MDAAVAPKILDERILAIAPAKAGTQAE